jgi:hypothetical protein
MVAAQEVDGSASSEQAVGSGGGARSTGAARAIGCGAGIVVACGIGRLPFGGRGLFGGHAVRRHSLADEPRPHVRRSPDVSAEPRIPPPRRRPGTSAETRDGFRRPLRADVTTNAIQNMVVDLAERLGETG